MTNPGESGCWRIGSAGEAVEVCSRCGGARSPCCTYLDEIERPRRAETLEQAARDLLEACGVRDAQTFTAGDLAPLANRLHEIARWRHVTGYEDPDVLDLTLGRAGIDHHLRALGDLWHTAQRERDDLRLERNTAWEHNEGLRQTLRTVTAEREEAQREANALRQERDRLRTVS